MKAFKTSGFFFKSTVPDTQVPGNLEFTPENGCRLTTIGTFDGHSMPLEQDADCIYGSCSGASGGKSITLIKNTSMGSSYSSSGISQEHFRTQFLLSGDHFPSGSLEKYETVTIKTNMLDVWVDRYAYAMNMAQGVNMFKDFSVTRTDYEDTPIKTGIGDIRVFHGMPITFGVQRKIELYDDVRLVVRLRKSLPVHGILDKVLWPIQILLTILSGKANLLTHVALQRSNNGEYISPLSLHYEQLSSKSPEEIEPKEHRWTQSQMLMTYSDLVQCKSNILKRWISIWPKMKGVIAGLSATMYGSYPYIDSKFLSIVSSLESYHRNFRPPIPAELNQSSQIRARLLNEYNGELSPWLERQLRFCHEPSLRHRISALCGDCWSLLNELKIPTECLINSIVDSRNQKVHGLSKNGRRILSGFGMHQANQIMTLMLQMAILYELGVRPSDAIKNLLKTDRATEIRQYVENGRLEI